MLNYNAKLMERNLLLYCAGNQLFERRQHVGHKRKIIQRF